MTESTIQENAKFSMDEKVGIELAIGEYQEADRHFDKAEKRLHEAKAALIKLLPANRKFVVRIEYEYFLVTTLDDGEFSVAPIDCLWQ